MTNDDSVSSRPDAAADAVSDADADAREFPCPQCGGDMAYDAGAQKLVCNHCAYSYSPPDDGDVIVEHDLERGLAASRQRGYGTPMRSAQCKECGATVSFGGSLTATHCDFCGSSQVLLQAESRHALRPESLVPFAVERTAAEQAFTHWLGRLWFRPSDLKRKARVAEMSGVYVPYWTFDSTVRSRWTADAGYYYYVTESYTTRDSQGRTVTRTRQVRKVRWQPASGSRSDHFDDVLVCASRGLPAELAARLETFDTKALRPYDPAFLAGWKAEEYAVELNDGWKQAIGHMTVVQKRRCASDVPGDTHRFLRVNNHFSDETFKHVLLPIWIAAYRYKDEVYRFLVNGQTGEVTGKAPYSALKIILFVLLLAGIAALILWLWSSGRQASPSY